MTVAEKVVIITGASSGIGAALAKHLVSIGYKKLALVARRKDRLLSVAKECEQNGAQEVLVMEKDLTNADQCKQVIDETVAKFGYLSVLVSNAGTATGALTRDAKIEDWDMVFSINMRASFVLTKHALPHLEKTKGCIVYNSTAVGKQSHRITFKYYEMNVNFFLKARGRAQLFPPTALARLLWITLPAAWLWRRPKMGFGSTWSALESFSMRSRFL